MKRGFKSQAEKKSLSLRKELGLKPHDPLCGFMLAKHLGIRVTFPEAIIGLDSDSLNHLNSKDANWSAVVLPIMGEEKFWIIHNPIHSPARQQSNLMHEIGHILCEHEFSAIGELHGVPMPIRSYDKEQEDEATWLGGCLQLPREALIWSMKRQMPYSEIGAHFNASVEMVRYRINRTGVKYQVKSYKF